jgi:hypothetical protein
MLISRRRFGAKGVAMGALAAMAIGATVAYAIEGIEFSIDAIDGPQWSARDLRLQFDLLEDGQRAYLTIDTLRFANSGAAIRALRIDCAAVEISIQTFSCRDSNVTAQVPGIGEQRFRAAVTYGRVDGSLDFAVRDWRIGGGEVSLAGQLLDESWRANAAFENVAIAEVIGIAAAFDLTVPIAASSGRITATVDARGRDTQPVRIALKGNVAELSLNNESGSLASEQLAARFGVSAQREGQAWKYTAELDASAGQAYAEPVFLDFGVHAFVASAAGSFTDDGVLTAERFSIEHADVLTAAGRVALNLEQEAPLRDLHLELQQLQFPGAYDSYLQPFLLDTNFKSLETSGSVTGVIDFRDGEPERLSVSLDALYVDGGDLNVSDLSGGIEWRMQSRDEEEDQQSPASIPVSNLRWAGGSLFGLNFGASELRMTLDQRNVRLVEPARIPFVDGALKLDSLRVRNAGMPTVAFLIDATLEPVSVQRLCQAFGWPEFGGQIGGTISKLRLRDGVITLGTTLEAQVFDGQVRVSDLRLEQPLSKWPRFHSNIELENLDLELVTSAFSFGRITGRLSGKIHELEMFNWSPIAFDASLHTPPNDRSRRRISQRAVENIGSMGGGSAGVTAALSSGFLRFFEDFNYRRLGISCRLRNEVCEMNGAAPAPNGGYYIVEGRGVPRIDVIGNSRRVDWPRLVRQLMDATQSSGPVVQ